MKGNKVKNFIRLLLPPFEAHEAQKDLDKYKAEERDFDVASLGFGIRKALRGVDDLQGVENYAKSVFDYEWKRREILENKALIYTSGFSLMAGASALIPPLFSKELSLPIPISVLCVFAYLIANIHIFMAVVFAFRSRQTEQISTLSPDLFSRALSNNENGPIDRIVAYLKHAKYNQPVLVSKSNYLHVAKVMFLRGLTILIIALLITGTTIVLQNIQSKLSPNVDCIVPNVVGLDQEPASNIISGLGLSVVKEVYYGNTSENGLIIDQWPLPGELSKGCNDTIIITVNIHFESFETPTSDGS